MDTYYGVNNLKIYKINKTESLLDGDKLIERYDIDGKVNKTYQKKYKHFYYLSVFKSLDEASSYLINILIMTNRIKSINIAKQIETFQNDRWEKVKYFQNCGKIEGIFERFDNNNVKIDEMKYINGILIEWKEFYENGSLKRLYLKGEKELLYNELNQLEFELDFKSNILKIYRYDDNLYNTVINNSIYNLNDGKDLINIKNIEKYDLIDIFYTLIKHFDRNFKISFHLDNHPQKDLIKKFIKLYERSCCVGDPFDQYMQYRPGKNKNLDDYWTAF